MTLRDYQRWARKGTTTQRGYGAAHVKILKPSIARWRPGDLCAWCHQPMMDRWMANRRGKRVSAIHLGHTADRTGYLGLMHAHCNTSEGASRGNRQRGMVRAWQSSRAW